MSSFITVFFCFVFMNQKVFWNRSAEVNFLTRAFKKKLKSNSRTIKYTLLKYIIHWHLVYLVLYNHYHWLIPEHSPLPQKKLYTHSLAVTSHFFLRPSPRQPSISFLPLWFAYSEYFIKMVSYKMWPFVSDFFHLVYFQDSLIL